MHMAIMLSRWEAAFAIIILLFVLSPGLSGPAAGLVLKAKIRNDPDAAARCGIATDSGSALMYVGIAWLSLF
jgi:hypothetical protein